MKFDDVVLEIIDFLFDYLWLYIGCMILLLIIFECVLCFGEVWIFDMLLVGL